MTYQCSVRRNEAQNGIEIQFSKRPPQEVLDQVKANGFRWSRRNKVWYTKYTAKKLEFASELCSENPANLLSVPEEVAGKRLITPAVVTSQGKVPKNLVWSELDDGRLEAAQYRIYDGMRDSDRYVKRENLEWKEPDAFDLLIIDIRGRDVNKNAFENIVWVASEGWIRFRDWYLRYKENVDRPTSVEDAEVMTDNTQQEEQEWNAFDRSNYDHETVMATLQQIGEASSQHYRYEVEDGKGALHGKSFTVIYTSRWEGVPTATVRVTVSPHTKSIGSVRAVLERPLGAMMGKTSTTVKDAWNVNPDLLQETVGEQLRALAYHYYSFDGCNLPEQFFLYHEHRKGWIVRVTTDWMIYESVKGENVIIRLYEDIGGKKKYQAGYRENAASNLNKRIFTSESSLRQWLIKRVHSIDGEQVEVPPLSEWDNWAALRYNYETFRGDSYHNPVWTEVAGPNGNKVRVLRIGDEPVVAVPSESSSRLSIIDLDNPTEVMTTLTQKEVISWLNQDYRARREQEQEEKEISQRNALPEIDVPEFKEHIARIQNEMNYGDRWVLQPARHIKGDKNAGYVVPVTLMDVDEDGEITDTPLVSLSVGYLGENILRPYRIQLINHSHFPIEHRRDEYSVAWSEQDQYNNQSHVFLVFHPVQADLEKMFTAAMSQKEIDDIGQTMPATLALGFPLTHTVLHPLFSTNWVSYTYFNKEYSEAITIVCWMGKTYTVLGYRGMDSPFVLGAVDEVEQAINIARKQAESYRDKYREPELMTEDTDVAATDDNAQSLLLGYFWLTTAKLVYIGRDVERNGVRHTLVQEYMDDSEHLGDEREIITEQLKDILLRKATEEEVIAYQNERKVPEDVQQRWNEARRAILDTALTPISEQNVENTPALPSDHKLFSQQKPWELPGYSLVDWDRKDGFLRAQYVSDDKAFTLNLRESQDFAGEDKLKTIVLDKDGVAASSWVNMAEPEAAERALQEVLTLAKRFAPGNDSPTTEKIIESPIDVTDIEWVNKKISGLLIPGYNHLSKTKYAREYLHVFEERNGGKQLRITWDFAKKYEFNFIFYDEHFAEIKKGYVSDDLEGGAIMALENQVVRVIVEHNESERKETRSGEIRSTAPTDGFQPSDKFRLNELPEGWKFQADSANGAFYQEGLYEVSLENLNSQVVVSLLEARTGRVKQQDKFGSVEQAKDYALVLMSEWGTPPSTPPASDKSLWTNDHYYTQNPQHVHDEFYEKSGQRGMVKSVRLAEGADGSVNSLSETLSRIDTANATLPSEQTVSVTATVTKTTSPTGTVADRRPAESNLERATRRNAEELGAKVKAKRKRANRTASTVDQEPLAAPQTANDPAQWHDASYVAQHFNPGLTEDDFRIYAHYQRVLGTPVGGYYASLPVPSHEELVAWVDGQKLYADNGILVPDYFYLSGDLYTKQQRFERDRGTIAEQWGEAVAQNQQEALSNALQGHLRKRLLLDSSVPESERLHLELLSELSETFFVSSLNSVDKFEGQDNRSITNAAKKQNKALSSSSWNTFDKLSLKDAFLLWLVKQKHNITVKFGLTVEDLINIHVYRQRRPSDEDKTVWSSMKARCKKEADRLFAIFLAEELLDEDRTRLEAKWNREHFAEADIDYRRIPIAFPIAKEYRDVEVDIRPEKRDAVTFMMAAGSGCLAYEVGYGKTWCYIFTVSQFIEMGRCGKALLVVPNQVYKQFLIELKGLAPHLAVYEYYNLDEQHLAYARANKPTDNSVTVMTYEGFRKVGFNEETQATLGIELDKILEQGIDDRARKQRQKDQLKVSKRQGQALRYTEIEVEDFGWDFFGVDEAHSMKKVFTAVKGEIKQGNREAQQYEVTGGMPSALATKGFMIAQYIQRKTMREQNRPGNVLLLTATPFTNSPLEVFSMLSLVGYDGLQRSGLENLKRFYDNYVEVDSRLVIDAKFQPVRKQVVTGFRNLRALQSVIYRYFDRKDIPLTSNKRPVKWILPLRSKLVDGQMVDVPADEQVEPILPLTAEQDEIMAAIKDYASGRIAFRNLCTGFGSLEADSEEVEDDGNPGELLEMSSLDDREQAGVRLLRSMNLARNVALSPYLHLCTNLGPLTYQSYVETSPKLHYVMRCIASVKQHHEQTNTPVSGQVIYMDRGVENFKLLKEYLVKVVGYQEHEVGIMRSNMSGLQPKGPNGKKVVINEAKDYVKNLFLGQRWDQETKAFYPIPDSERIKVVIGTSTIKEGVNLQRYGTVLYNCFVDWNPTDQIQLEGRIWRQGNQYKNVRIVNVLMEDSADIFLFQKLEEKTGRINQLWNRDGTTNTFNLDEFNPEELKYSLISDPNVIAQLEVKEEKNAIEDAKLSVRSEIKQLRQIEFYFQQMQVFPQRIKELLDDYLFTYQPPQDAKAAEEYLFDKLKKLARNQKMPFDGDLDTPVRSWVSIQEYFTVGKGAAHRNASWFAEDMFNPSWFADFARFKRAIDRVLLTYMQPKGLTLEDLPKQRDKFTAELEKLERDQELLSAPEAMASRLRRIQMDREAAAVESKNLPARVKEFASLNYLLDERKVPVMVEKKNQAPRREQIEKALGGLVALEKYSSGEQKESVGKAVRGLRTLLKYTPAA